MAMVAKPSSQATCISINMLDEGDEAKPEELARMLEVGKLWNCTLSLVSIRYIAYDYTKCTTKNHAKLNTSDGIDLELPIARHPL